MIPRLVVACPGISHVDRGYESFSLELWEVLRAHGRDDTVLLRGSGAPGPQQARARCLRRDGAAARAMARAAGARSGYDLSGAVPRRRRADRSTLRDALTLRLAVDPYDVEQATFAVSAAAHLGRRSAVVFVSDVLVARALHRLRRALRAPWRLVFTNGAPWPPPIAFADVVQEITGPAHDRALAGGASPDRHVLLPLGFGLPAPADLSAAERAAVRARLGLRPDGRVLLSVGALNMHHKRHHRLVAAVARIPAPRPQLVLLGASEGETDVLRRLAAETLGDDVLLRTVPGHEVPIYYSAADAFALASTREGFGRVYVEAAAAGLPVVAHDFDVPRWVLGAHGVFVDTDDDRAFARALEHVVQAPPDPDRRRRAHAEMAARFSWESLAGRYVDLAARAMAFAPATT